MSIQLDLFAEPARKPWTPTDDHDDWERGFLHDLHSGPIVACYPGFTGAMLERLVTKGLAVREDWGFMGPPLDLTGQPVKIKGFRKQDFPQFRYSLNV